ncbi:MAG: RdgB/HAM1 family non-canonical purine NTP pyrophosphatase [Treponema sp.]|jgi:XTP/dITP diphosphohydrolase|nr:RdgB/HAM1 family non-canonical purine NTP pyrophosphatase [Treponema sp.]
MKIWFASGNLHKKQEAAALFPGWDIKLPGDAGLPFDPEETGSTFLENALLKARILYRQLAAGGLGGPVLADDSGICVDALGGRPGIYSARYAGRDGAGLPGREKPEASDRCCSRRRNALLLEELGDTPNRKARFVCAMVLLWDENRFLAVQETLEGELVRPGEGRGAGGFGYDPIFSLPNRGITVAELSGAEKNRISHRGKAARLIAGLLEGNGALLN